MKALGGVVVVVKPRNRSRGSAPAAGWENRRLLLSSAKVDALIHAARHDCEPAVPLIQPDVVMIMKRRDILDIDCPQGLQRPAAPG
jgi:hypothetical protein